MIEGETAPDQAKETGLRNISDLLSEDDVWLIGQLSDSLERSTLNFVQLDIQGLQVSLAKGRLPEADLAVAAPAAAPASPLMPAAENAAAEGTVAITAPLIGFYHAQAESGLGVSVGSAVDEDAAIGFILLMNLRKPVPAGMRGVIAEMCVESGQFVEYGQTLCRVRPV